MRAGWLVFLLCGTAWGETPRSPYHMTWSFPTDEPSAIEIDRGDLSMSRFETDFDLVRFLATRPRAKKVRSVPGATAAPSRELRVDSLGDDGRVRTTVRYAMTLADWRLTVGERMVERLEDEFDAHLRMLLPRKKVPTRAAPTAPPDLGTP